MIQHISNIFLLTTSHGSLPIFRNSIPETVLFWGFDNQRKKGYMDIIKTTPIA